MTDLEKYPGNRISGRTSQSRETGSLGVGPSPHPCGIRAGDSASVDPSDLAGHQPGPRLKRLLARQAEAEATLRKSNYLQRTIENLARIGGWELDLRTSEVIWTDQCYRIHELPLGKMPSLAEAITYYHVDDRPVIEAAVNAAIATGQPYELELRFITAKGNALWVHTAGEAHVENGKTVRLFGFIRDITESKTADLKRRDREKYSRQLIENSEISIWCEDLTEVCKALDSLKASGVENLRDHLDRNRPLVRKMSRLVRVLFVNDATFRLFEMEKTEKFNAGISKTFDETSHDTFCKFLCALWDQRKIFWSETTFRTLKGRTFDAIITFQLPDSADGLKNVAVSIVDISPTKEKERKLAVITEDLDSRVREMHALYSVLDLLHRSDCRFDQMMQGIADILPSAWHIPEMTTAQIVINGISFSSKNFKYTRWRQESRIFIDDAEVGTLTVCCRKKTGEKGGPSLLPEGQVLLDKVSQRIGEYFKTRRANEQLNAAALGAVRAVAATLEKRDPYTAGHQSRVADLSVAIARQLNWDQFKIEGLRLGSLIHDIGKISIPTAILTRPGKLSIEEFNLIKTHPIIGFEIVEHTEFPWPIKEMILQHHERIDGSGYPYGLTGDQIIDEAKVIAVADVIEAISTSRPYRTGLGLKFAMKELERGRGRHYDAEIVDICIKLLRSKKFIWRKPRPEI